MEKLAEEAWGFKNPEHYLNKIKELLTNPGILAEERHFNRSCCFFATRQATSLQTESMQKAMKLLYDGLCALSTDSTENATPNTWTDNDGRSLIITPRQDGNIQSIALHEAGSSTYKTYDIYRSSWKPSFIPPSW